MTTATANNPTPGATIVSFDEHRLKKLMKRPISGLS